MKQTIKLKESKLRNLVREALTELDWKTYMNAAKKRLAQGKDANARELSDMAKSRFDDEYNDNYKYDTLGDKLAGKHSKTFDSTFSNLEAPEVRGRNEKGEDLFRVNGKYYNSSRGLTTPGKFFKDKNMSDKFNTATKELDDYNSGAYDYTDEKGWHLKESQLHAIIKEGIKKVLNENTGNVWDILEELKQYMNSDDILARLISRIGEYPALKYLEDIKNVEIGDTMINEDDFTSHAYKTTSNLGGKEIEISRSNDAVRFRTEDGSISDWFEIEYDGEGNPIVNTPWGVECLNDYMRTNFPFG